MITCEYCNNEFKNNTVLKTHQKTAKYCLVLRDDLVGDYSCCYCNRVFTTKQTNINHEKICKLSPKNKSSEEYDEEIAEVKRENIILHEKNILLNNQLEQMSKQLCQYQKQIEQLQLSITDLAKQGMAKSTVTKNTKNTKNTNIQLNMTPMVMCQKAFKEKIDSNLTIEDVFDAPNGIADFLYKVLLVDKNGNKMYVCTDSERKNFYYYDEQGNKQTDKKGLRFWSLAKVPLFEFSERLIQDELDKLDNTVDHHKNINIHCIMKKAEKIDDLKSDGTPIISLIAAKSYAKKSIPQA